MLKQVSIALVTFVVSALAVAFNIGFFFAVGTIFISLFTIQEHIVFSLSGSAVVLGVTFIMAFVQQARFGDRWSLPWIVNGILFSTMYCMIVGSALWSQYLKYGPVV
jgi:hypothetical protein